METIDMLILHDHVRNFTNGSLLLVDDAENDDANLTDFLLEPDHSDPTFKALCLEVEKELGIKIANNPENDDGPEEENFSPENDGEPEEESYNPENDGEPEEKGSNKLEEFERRHRKRRTNKKSSTSSQKSKTSSHKGKHKKHRHKHKKCSHHRRGKLVYNIAPSSDESTPESGPLAMEEVHVPPKSLEKEDDKSEATVTEVVVVVQNLDEVEKVSSSSEVSTESKVKRFRRSDSTDTRGDEESNLKVNTNGPNEKKEESPNALFSTNPNEERIQQVKSNSTKESTETVPIVDDVDEMIVTTEEDSPDEDGKDDTTEDLDSNLSSEKNGPVSEDEGSPPQNLNKELSYEELVKSMKLELETPFPNIKVLKDYMLRTYKRRRELIEGQSLSKLILSDFPALADKSIIRQEYFLATGNHLETLIERLDLELTDLLNRSLSKCSKEKLRVSIVRAALLDLERAQFPVDSEGLQRLRRNVGMVLFCSKYLGAFRPGIIYSFAKKDKDGEIIVNDIPNLSPFILITKGTLTDVNSSLEIYVERNRVCGVSGFYEAMLITYMLYYIFWMEYPVGASPIYTAMDKLMKTQD